MRRRLALILVQWRSEFYLAGISEELYAGTTLSSRDSDGRLKLGRVAARER